jgi:hypothetical protein
VTASVSERVRRLDWAALEAALDTQGHARAPLLDAAECRALAALYDDDRRFRSKIDMAPRRFGLGEYKYFAYPLPRLVQSLRTELYRRLAPVANRFAERLHLRAHHPPALREYLARCHAAGQKRPTPLLLRYGPGGYNCLHQDRYGDLLFPLQVAIFLSRPGVDYEGGAFLLVEQRPRAQSRGEAIVPAQGEMVIFPSAFRPLPTKRGFARAPVRHGVATLTHGARMTLGIIFHDAR